MSYGTSYKAPALSTQFSVSNFTQTPYKPPTPPKVSDQQNLTVTGTFSVAGLTHVSDLVTTGIATLSASSAPAGIESNVAFPTSTTLVNKQFVDSHAIKTDGTSELAYDNITIGSLGMVVNGKSSCPMIARTTDPVHADDMLTLGYADSHYGLPTGDVACASIVASGDISSTAFTSASSIHANLIGFFGTSSISGTVTAGAIHTTNPTTSTGIATKSYGDSNWGLISGTDFTVTTINAGTISTGTATVTGNTDIVSGATVTGALTIDSAFAPGTLTVAGPIQTTTITDGVTKTYCDSHYLAPGAPITSCSALTSSGPIIGTSELDIFNDTTIGGSLSVGGDLKGIGVYRSSVFAPTVTCEDGSWTMQFTPITGGWTRVGNMVQLSLSGTTTGPYDFSNTSKIRLTNLPYPPNTSNWRFGGRIIFNRSGLYPELNVYAVQQNLATNHIYLSLANPPNYYWRPPAPAGYSWPNKTMQVSDFQRSIYAYGTNGQLVPPIIGISMQFYYYTT